MVFNVNEPAQHWSDQAEGIIARRGWVCQRKNGRGVARCPSCSQNAHAQKVLVRRAQLRIDQATLQNVMGD